MNKPIIRPANFDDVDTIAKVHVLSWQNTYQNIIPRQFLDNLSIKRRAKDWKQILGYNQSHPKNGLFVAADNNNLIGFVGCGPARDADFFGYAEVYAIYVLTEYQKHGWGRKLIEHAKSFLRKNGFSRAYVWSLEQNFGAHKAYEAWGAKPNLENTKTIDIDGTKLKEHIHIWEW